MASGKSLCQFQWPLDDRELVKGAGCIALSADGRTAATAVDDIRLWEILTGQQRWRFEKVPGGVDALAFSPDGRTLAAGYWDTTILLWDLLSPGQDRGRTRRLGPADLEQSWQALGSADAQRAYAAVVRLAAHPAQAAPLLARKLRQYQARHQRLPRLIQDLDADDFATRERASAELAALGRQVEGALQRALSASRSAEARRRIEELLNKHPPLRWPQDELEADRAVEALELMNSVDARQILRELAEGSPDSRLTKEAKVTLERRFRRINAP